MKKNRPQTPLITITKKTSSNNNEYYLKNFSNFLKQIIDNKNDKFLNGDKSLIEYLLSKYLSIPESHLSKIKKLSIIINHDYGLLNQFGKFLPSLQLLKLNNSNILSFNNVGTSFTNIKCLQMKHCHLKDLEGLICLQNLEILDVEGNDIDDLVDIDMCESIKELNVKENKISEEDNLSYVAGLINLEYFDIRFNPISEKKDFKTNIISKFGIDQNVFVWDNKNQKDIVGKFDDEIVEDVVFDNNNQKVGNKLKVDAKKNNFEEDDNDVIIQEDQYSAINNNKINKNINIKNQKENQTKINNENVSDITLETIIKNAKSSSNIFKDMSFDNVYKEINKNNDKNLLNSQSSVNVNSNKNINNNFVQILKNTWKT